MAPPLNEPGPGFDPTRPEVRRFGEAIASRRSGGQPSNKVYCLRPSDLRRLDEILNWYAELELDPTFYVSPLGFSREMAAALVAAGFAQREFRQAILYGVPIRFAAPRSPGLTVESVEPAALDEWAETLAAAFEWPVEWRAAAMESARRCFAPADGHLLARVEGRPAAVATLGLRDDIGALSGGAVRPELRGRGLHLDLVRHRLSLAHTIGLRLVVGSADFSSGSFRNQLRAGLRVAYVESGWSRP